MLCYLLNKFQPTHFLLMILLSKMETLFSAPSHSPVLCVIGALVSAEPSRHIFMQISMHTFWKTAREKYACSQLWTGWKTTCSSTSVRVHQQHQLLQKRRLLHDQRKRFAGCGSTVTTSTIRQRGRTSWSGPRSWACQDSACQGNLVLCAWKVLSLPARSSGPGILVFLFLEAGVTARSLLRCEVYYFSKLFPISQSEGSYMEEDHDST